MKLILFVVSIMFFAVGCTPKTDCIRQVNDQGQTVISCPRMAPVVLEESVDEDCQRDAQFIVCGDKRFNTSGKRVLDDVSVPPVMDLNDLDDLDENNDRLPGVQNTPTLQRTSCIVGQTNVLCQNGWQADRPDDPAFDQASCQTMIIAGVGNRIVCRKANQPLLVLIPDGVEDKPTCTRAQGAISCTDGSSVIDESLDDDTTCLNPRVETTGRVEEAIRCIDECEQGFCEACEEILGTRIVCEDDTEYPVAVGCYFPQGLVHIFDDASAQDLLNRSCNTINADVLIAPKKDSEVYIDARLLRVLSRTRVIVGSLIIQRMDLPPNQADRDQYLRLDIPLATITRDLNVRYSKRVPLILPESRLLVIGGSLNMEVHDDLVALDFPKLKRVLGSIYISSNAQLDTIAFDDEIRIDGQFTLANLPKLDPCDLADWLVWSLDHAASVLILHENVNGFEQSC